MDLTDVKVRNSAMLLFVALLEVKINKKQKTTWTNTSFEFVLC